MASTQPSRSILFTLAFLEGAGVMMLEAMTAKYLSPIYGDSLHVWATAVGLTLVSLTLGYFLGAALAEKRPGLLFPVMLSAGTYIALVPVLAAFVIPRVITGAILLDCLLVGSVCLLLPLALLGMVPALLVAHLSDGQEDSGAVAGRVFGISTVGGIVAVFLAGFVLVPNVGVSLPLMLAGTALAAVPAWQLLRQGRYAALAGPGLVLLAFGLQGQVDFPKGGDFRMRYYSEGILGQVMVADFAYASPQRQKRIGRALYVNRVPQTLIDLETGQPLFSPYIDWMNEATQVMPEGMDVLMLGGGGGNLVRKLRQRKHRVDICELDARVTMASRKYFFPDRGDTGTQYITDDARHFLRTTEKQYDLIVFDIFKGENPPHHAFTVEAFADARARLKAGGALIINFLGRIEGERSDGPRALIRTIREAGFALTIIAMPKLDNVIVVAAEDTSPWAASSLKEYFVPEGRIDLQDAPVLEDDRPLLELLHTETATWNRQWYNKTYTYEYLKKDIPLYK